MEYDNHPELFSWQFLDFPFADRGTREGRRRGTRFWRVPWRFASPRTRGWSDGGAVAKQEWWVEIAIEWDMNGIQLIYIYIYIQFLIYIYILYNITVYN